MENISNFERICSLKIENTFPFHMYKSLSTGITICFAEIEGPCDSVYFYINHANEKIGDTILPDALERLIFTGSEKYPYTGTLKEWCKRCLATTSIQASSILTSYQVKTPGTEGLLCLLPVYLDHIFYPTLTDSAFLTKIYHITGKGEDGGDLYCTYKSNENTLQHVVQQECMRAMYNKNCSPQSTYKGVSKSLFKITNKEVKHYHKRFYIPENLTIFITGQVKHDTVFQTLLPLEKKLMSERHVSTFEGPSQTLRVSEVFTESKELVVYYPHTDNNISLTFIWRGPLNDMNDLYELLSCTVLVHILKDKTGPIKKTFSKSSTVNVEFSQASLTEMFDHSLFQIHFLANTFKQMMRWSLEKTFNKLRDKSMTAVKNIIHQLSTEVLSSLENDPHNYVDGIIKRIALKSINTSSVKKRCNILHYCKQLENESESYWTNLFEKYFINTPMIVLTVISSIHEHEEFMESETKRKIEQIIKLGPNGLKQKKIELLQAIQKIKRPIPNKVLANIPILNTDSINFYSIKTYTTETLEQHPGFDVRKLPFLTYLNHINALLLHLHVIMDTSSLSREQRKYVLLLLHIIQMCVQNREYVNPSEKEADMLPSNIVFATEIGMTISKHVHDTFSQAACLAFTAKLDQYEQIVEWIKTILYNIELSADILKKNIHHLIILISIEQQYLLQHYFNSLIRELTYNKNSNQAISKIYLDNKFLSNVLERLNTDTEQVILEVESVRKILTSPKNVALKISVNVDRLTAEVPDVYAPWNIYFSDIIATEKMKFNITSDWALMNHTIKTTNSNGYVVGYQSCPFVYLYQTYHPSKFDTVFQNPDYPSLIVCLKYLNEKKGPLAKILGHENCILEVIPYEGLITALFTRILNIVDAYNKMKLIVKTLLAGDKWNKELFETAKLTSIKMIIEFEENINDVAHSVDFFSNIPRDYKQQLIRRISDVTINDLTRVTALYIMPLFDPKLSKLIIMCHPSKVAEIGEAFKRKKHNLELYNSYEEKLNSNDD